MALVFLRTATENFSNNSFVPYFSTDFPTLVHYSTYFFVVALLLILLFHIFGKRSVSQATNVALVCMTVIIIPPFFDLINTRGSGSLIAYQFAGETNPFLMLVKLSQGLLTGISPGILVAISVLCTVSFLYVFVSTRSWLRGTFLLLTLCSLFLFFYASPQILGLTPSISWFSTMQTSLISTNFLHPEIVSTSQERTFEVLLNVTMGQFYYLLGVVLLLLIFLRWNRIKTCAVIQNLRLTRTAHYVLMVIFGIFLAYAQGLFDLNFVHWSDVTTLIILVITVICSWGHAVARNDIQDLEGDKLSNKNRPLVSGLLSKGEVQISSDVFLILALVGGFLSGHHAFFFTSLFLLLAYVYSEPPFRLKRFVIVNPFIVSLASAAVLLAGFYTVSSNPSVDIFPLNIVLLLIVFYTLGLGNIKDIKDYKGDLHMNVLTIPVLFGPVTGRRIVGVLTVIAFISVPLISRVDVFWYPSIFAAPVAYYLITKTPYKDRDIFILYFLYLASLTVVVLL